MSPSRASNDTSHFHPFPRLPKELRERRASLEPRIVYVHAHLLSPGFTNRIWSNKTLDDDTFFDLGSSALTPRPRLAFKSKSTVPILYVCSESRNVATHIYSLAFGHSSYACTWFDFKNDTLLVDWTINRPYGRDAHGVSYGVYLPEDLGVDAGKVEKLAVRRPSGVQESEWIMEVLQNFNNLEILTDVDKIHYFEDKNSADLVALENLTWLEVVMELFKKLVKCDMSVEEDLESRENYYRWCAESGMDVYRGVMLQLREDQRAGAHKSIRIPQLQVRSFTSRQRLDEYHQARKLYEIERELRPITITVESARQHTRKLAVHESWTLKDVIEKYRKAAQIPHEQKYEQAICKHADEVLCLGSTIGGVGLTSGAVISVEFGG